MRVKLTARHGFIFLSSFMKLLAIHPPLKNVKCFRCLAKCVLWWFYQINHIILLLLTLKTFFETSNDIISVSYSLIEITGMVESIVILITFKVQENRLKVLLSFVKNQLFIRQSSIRLNDSRTYVLSFSSIMILYIIVLYMYINKSNARVDGKLIMTLKYPFPIDSMALKTLLYSSQMLVLLHTSVILLSDGVIVLILYTCATKLKNLEIEWRTASNNWLFIKIIHQHRIILRYLKDANQIARIIVFKTVLSFMCYSISSGLQVFQQDTVAQMIHQFVILAIVYLRLYVCAESAENLMTISEDIQFTVYSSPWYDGRPKNIITKIGVIRRCQNPPKIYINGFMPALNRSYLKTILYTTFSYFMTIRAVIQK